MKSKLIRSFIIIAGLSLSIIACKKMEDSLEPQPVTLELPETPYDYSTFNNGGFFTTNFVDNDQATLGRVLFYDTQLSINNSISCGSCHKQSIGFSDNKKFSAGFENRPTGRNTLPIHNISNQNSFVSPNPSLFWDGRSTFLPVMVLMPVTNHVEMGMSDIDAIVQKVRSLSYYEGLFLKAYGSPDITSDGISNALSAFVSSIFSTNTKFDRAQNNFDQLSGLEAYGKDLFFNKYNCNSCHQTTFINGYEVGGRFVNIGLDENYRDVGLQNVTQNPIDNGKFKIPGLRNIALTGPYMHDGRFASLSEVIEHYSHGVADSPALDDRLRDNQGRPMKMNISDDEKTALIAFLNSMTDYSLITDVKFSNPFKAK